METEMLLNRWSPLERGPGGEVFAGLAPHPPPLSGGEGSRFDLFFSLSYELFG